MIPLKSDDTQTSALFRGSRERFTALDILGCVLRRVYTMMRVIHEVKPIYVRLLQ